MVGGEGVTLPCSLGVWPQVQQSLRSAKTAIAEEDVESVGFYLHRAACLVRDANVLCEGQDNFLRDGSTLSNDVLLRVIDAALDIDATRPIEGLLSLKHGQGAATRAVSRNFLKSLVACALLHLVPARCEEVPVCSTRRPQRPWHVAGISSSLGVTSTDTSAVLHIFERQGRSSVSTLAMHSKETDPVTFRRIQLDTSPDGTPQPSLDDWLRSDALLCPLLLHAAVDDCAHNEAGCDARAVDFHLELLASRIFVERPHQDEAIVVQKSEHSCAERGEDCLIIVAERALGVTSDDNDCYEVSRVLHHLNAAFVGMTHNRLPSDNAPVGNDCYGQMPHGMQQDVVGSESEETSCGATTVCSAKGGEQSAATTEDFLATVQSTYSRCSTAADPLSDSAVTACSMLSEAAASQRNAADSECDIETRPKALHVPSIILCEGGNTVKRDGYDDAACSPPPTPVSDGSLCSFADALAASLLGDALTRRACSEGERRPSMPTILEEALTSCFGFPTDNRDDRILDFADRLAANVLCDALTATRNDSLVIENNVAPSESFRRQFDAGEIGSVIFDKGCGSWLGVSKAEVGRRKLEDFSSGLLAGVIKEAKLEWYGRAAGTGEDNSRDDDDTASDHASFFRREFVDRFGGNAVPSGRRGSAPASWIAESVNLERRGSAPCVSTTRMRLDERRLSDYFNDEFVKGLRQPRRGSAPAIHGHHQSDDEYFDAEFDSSSRRGSVTLFVRGDSFRCSDPAFLRASIDDVSFQDGSCWEAQSPALDLHSWPPGEAFGYVALYSDVLLENVMRAGFKDLSRLIRDDERARCDEANEKDVDDGVSQSSKPELWQPLEPREPLPEVSRFAKLLARDLMDDVFSSLQGSLATLQTTSAHISSMDGQDGMKTLPVSVANWDSGVVGRCCSQLATLLQWIAASAAAVPCIHCSASESQCRGQLEAIISHVEARNVRAGALTSIVLDFCHVKQLGVSPDDDDVTLFAYTLSRLLN